MCTPDCCLALLALVFPPVAVCLKRGCCTADFFINIGLFLLGYVPGLIHAWYLIFRHPERTPHTSRRLANASPSGVYVVGNGPPTYPQQRHHPGADPNVAISYGAVGNNRPVYVYQENSPPPVPPRVEQQQRAVYAPAHRAGGSTGSHSVPSNQQDHLHAPQQQHQPQQQQEFQHPPPPQEQKQRPPNEHVPPSTPLTDGGSSSSAVPARQQRSPPAGSAASLIPSAPELEDVIDAPPRYEEIDSKFV